MGVFLIVNMNLGPNKANNSVNIRKPMTPLIMFDTTMSSRIKMQLVFINTVIVWKG